MSECNVCVCLYLVLNGSERRYGLTLFWSFARALSLSGSTQVGDTGAAALASGFTGSQLTVLDLRKCLLDV